MSRLALFPYATLFRSLRRLAENDVARGDDDDVAQAVGRQLEARAPVRPVVDLGDPRRAGEPGDHTRGVVRSRQMNRRERSDRKSTRLNSSHANTSYAV